jgi:hypothetical protein
MKEIDDPYHYEKPEWLILKQREHRRQLREKRLGRPIGTWGGKRPGAGIKKKIEEPKYTNLIALTLNNIQKQVLIEMGNGDLDAGIQNLINQHV